MAQSELSIKEIATLCGLPLEQVAGWADQGHIRPGPADCAVDGRVPVSEWLSCLKSQGIEVPQQLKNCSRRVLIIDDEAPMANAIKRVLRRSGYETFIAEDGFAAGSMLERLEPVLVTLDLSMPGLDGFDVLRFIRHQPRYKSLKILVVSALPDNQLQRALDLGADGVLSKPFDNNTLQQRIAALLASCEEVADA